jgi:hypothetical protein
MKSTRCLLNNLALRIFYTILGGEDFNIITRRALAHRVLQFTAEDVWWIMDNSHMKQFLVCGHKQGSAGTLDERERIIHDIQLRWRYQSVAFRSDIFCVFFFYNCETHGIYPIAHRSHGG